MQETGVSMTDMLIVKAFAFVPKLICAVIGAILALVLSGDIDKDGKIQVNRGVVLRFFIAVLTSLFFGEWIIEHYQLHTSIAAQGSIMILTAVFGLMIIGVIYQGIAVLKGKPIGEVLTEIVSAFKSIFGK